MGIHEDRLGGLTVIADAQRYVGKETGRRWQQGQDLSLLDFTPLEYRRSNHMVTADARLLEQLGKVGMRQMMRRTGLSQHTLEAVRRRQLIRRNTLATVQQRLKG